MTGNVLFTKDLENECHCESGGVFYCQKYYAYYCVNIEKVYCVYYISHARNISLHVGNFMWYLHNIL